MGQHPTHPRPQSRWQRWKTMIVASGVSRRLQLPSSGSDHHPSRRSAVWTLLWISDVGRWELQVQASSR